ncbi:hypothetical protein [Burkholderia cepacia]|uniref:hypothetical protein n=1 Tax=Burkholderia cepacia TaxID=292 RepID=UPI001CB62133|nr:hypothetical protein [Burkholderia cepacia]MCA8029006.1 hypothetical protein [Burkholderia cepacia]MCA8353227.1 hypothetical protein [Burkholderia cepacia]CAG9249318.1 hypothetical protein BCEP4_1200003 [Burkholderia cepacia]
MRSPRPLCRTTSARTSGCGRQHGPLLRYFSLVTTVGTPQSAAAQELRMECMFPADDATDARHRQLLDAHAPMR